MLKILKFLLEQSLLISMPYCNVPLRKMNLEIDGVYCIEEWNLYVIFYQKVADLVELLAPSLNLFD